MSAFYITTAIEYANGEPHLGHAFEKIGADAIARYHRLRGDTVHLLVGTDDHGLKVARAAAAAGVTPREQADRISAIFRRTWDTLGIHYDRFVRTTAPHHSAGVRALIARIIARDPSAFYERAYDGWYCVGCEAFRTPRELEDGRCPVHPTLAIERIAESNWFFRLSAHQQFLAEFLRTNPEFVRPPSRYNEVLAFVDRGLEDVSITRASTDWGIPFPLAARDGRHQAIYVWFDALPSYLTATGYPEPGNTIAWPAQVHVVGKDITRFHCVLWPAVLRAAGLPLPESVWAHGFVTAGGARLSKTAGVWIDVGEAIARHGPDALRYFLLREVPFDDDGDFSWDRFDARYTADLANTLGNLTSRLTALIGRWRGGRLPAAPGDGAVPEPVRAELRRQTDCDDRSLQRYVDAFESFLPHAALAAVWSTLGTANETVSRLAPWRLAGEPAGQASFDATVWHLVRALARQAVLLAPVLPAKADELWQTLGGPGSVHDQRIPDLGTVDPTGWRVVPGLVLFRRPARAIPTAGSGE
jgi:methionyl-tRNA synthetase